LYNPKTHAIKVKDTLQLDDPAYPHIFAAGDVADTGDIKMSYKATLHGPIIAKNIKSLLSGQEANATYKPSTGSEMMVIPMGKMGGVSYLSFFGGFTLGNWATKQMKGKGLFVDQQKKLLVRY
jgi:apoptosis-inducing factor 2